MRRIALGALCALTATTALCVSLATAVTASAATPTWFECGKAEKVGREYTGHYTSKTCASEDEVLGGGKYELREGLGKDKEFKGKGQTATSLAISGTLGSVTVRCDSSAERGKPALPNLETGVSFTFKHCAMESKGCNSTGAKKGEIVVPGLKGQLSELKEPSSTTVAVKLESEAHPGAETTLASVECEGLTAAIKGSLTARQTGDVNTLVKTFETDDLAAEFSTGGEQSIDDKGEALMLKTEAQGGEEEPPPTRSLLVGKRLEHENGGDSKQREFTPIKFTATKSGTVEELYFETAYAYFIKETGEHEATSLVLGIEEQGANGKPGKILGEGTYHGSPGEDKIVSVGGLKVPIVKGKTYYLDFLPLGGGISYWYSKAETIIYSVNHNELSEGNPENYAYQTEAHEAPIGEWAVGS